ncbi:MAG: DinB family protein [Saprospiraceae bacterium]
MTIQNIETFLEYYERVRERTRKVVVLIPEDHLEWTYRKGKFTLGDLVRHIAAIERHLYAENVEGRPSKYAGCGPELTANYPSTLDYFDDMHHQSVAIFQKLTPEMLQHKIQTPAGMPITCWKWLRALIEHEIHHRGQIYLYLNMLDIKTPPLYGLTAEQVEALSVK